MFENEKIIMTIPRQKNIALIAYDRLVPQK